MQHKERRTKNKFFFFSSGIQRNVEKSKKRSQKFNGKKKVEKQY